MKRPLSDHLLVQPEPYEQHGPIALIEKTILDYQLSRPRVSRVLAVGPGRRNRRGVLLPLEISVGDRVIHHSDYEGPVDAGEGQLLINAGQVLAVLPRGNPA